MMTPELAAERAASALDLAGNAVNNDCDSEKAAMLAGIAAVWVQLHTALANAPKQPPLNRLATAMTTSTPPADLRERAREWVEGFHEATEQDRVNCVALLLGAADDAYACAMDGHKTRATLLALGWTPPAEPRPDDVATTFP